jgi:hypothetical protein
METNTHSGTDIVIDRLMEFSSERLLGIIRLNESKALKRMAARVLVERTQDGATLTAWAQDSALPDYAREMADDKAAILAGGLNERQARRISAGRKMVERTQDAASLIFFAKDTTAPDHVRKIAGAKAVRLTENVETLIEWARDLELPVCMKTAAGLKAIKLAITQGTPELLEKLRYPMMPDAVLTALNCLGPLAALKRVQNPLAADGGTLIKGTIPAPAAAKNGTIGPKRICTN